MAGTYIRTEEIRKKISNAHVGLHPSEETRRKMSLSHTGLLHTDDEKRKISISAMGHKRNLGRKLSEEHKKSIGRGNKGKKHTEETRKKLSLSQKKRVESGVPNGFLGHRHSNEWKHKMSILRRGSKGWNWKGGITTLCQQIRACFKSKEWRLMVFGRDNFTCCLCGKRGDYLEADHWPKTFQSIFHENKITNIDEAIKCEEFWNINNGRTLCYDCHHKKVHKKWQ